jgi:RNA polymerase sigma factor (sigma-70 family)
MNSSTIETGVQCLRRLMASSGRQEESDELLLHAFLTRRDDSAFAVLVRRHGPMVLHVCRRVLGHEQDAEDAFQATFLVLARSAASLRNKASLASFLHGTALRTAMKAKQSAARLGKRQGSLGARTQLRLPVSPADELSWREVRTLVDEEIARLPEKYRTVFVLCCVENVSQAEAARRLGLKERTLSSQMAAARRRLRQGLRRRGVELTAVLAASALATPPASALPAGLMAKTMKAVLATASGKELAGVVSASVGELVHGATAAMVSKTKIVMAMTLAVGLLSGAGVCFLASPQRQQGQPLLALRAGEQSVQTPRSAKREAAESIEIHGRVLDPDGKPKAGAKLLLLGGDKMRQFGATAADGRFTVAVPKEAMGSKLIAQADGFGIDFLDLPKSDPKKPLELRLVKDHAIRGRVINTEGKPVTGATITLTLIYGYKNDSLDSFLTEWKERSAMSGFPFSAKAVEGHTIFPKATTDKAGRFTFTGAGIERLVTLHMRGPGIAEADLYVVNRPGFDPQPLNKVSKEKLNALAKRVIGLPPLWLLWGSDPEIVAEASKPIRGVVKDFHTGKPRPGVRVTLSRNGNDVVPIPLSAITDKEGRYEIHGAGKSAKGYMVEVPSDPATGHMACQGRSLDTPGYEPVTIDIRCRKGVVITGRMIDQGTGKGLRGIVWVGVLNDNPFVKEYPEFLSSTSFSGIETAGNGTFRVVSIPGPVLLMGGPDFRKMREKELTPDRYKPAMADPKYSQYFPKKRGPAEIYFTVGGSLAIVQGTYAKVLEIKPEAGILKQDIVLERASILPMKIVDAANRPVKGTRVAGISPQDGHPPVQLAGDTCNVYHLEPGMPRLIVVYDPAGKQYGTLWLRGDEKEAATVKLGPGAKVTGRLVDENGRPLSGFGVGLYHLEHAAEEIGKQVRQAKVTDADGKFTVDVVPGVKMKMYFTRGARRFQAMKRIDETAAPGKTLDLGDVLINLDAEVGEE